MHFLPSLWALAIDPRLVRLREYHLRSAKPNMTFHDRVSPVLNALCEGNGVIELRRSLDLRIHPAELLDKEAFRAFSLMLTVAIARLPGDSWPFPNGL